MNLKKIHKVDENFFKKWNPNMAYVLGYFIADGCITVSKGRKSNPYTFNITSVDKEHLEKMVNPKETLIKSKSEITSLRKI